MFSDYFDEGTNFYSSNQFNEEPLIFVVELFSVCEGDLIIPTTLSNRRPAFDEASCWGEKTSKET